MMKYNTYKPSETQWFKQVPLHWETFRFIDKVFLKHGFQFRDYDFTDEGIKVIKITQLNPDGSLDTDNCSFIDRARLREFKSIIISEGDILMALTGGTIGKIVRVGKVSEPLLQNYRVGNFFPNKKALDKNYLYYLLSSQITEEQINYLLNRNGQPNIGKESFKNMFFPLPPFEEQTAIAQYLDTKTQAIDKKINLLSKKADHYKELRKSIINNAVCKGLDKNVKLKESGVYYISSVPNHWKTERIKDIFYIGRGRVIGQEALEENGKYPVYSSQTENNGCLGFINSFDFDKDLLTWTTDGANAGTVFRRSGKFNCTNVCGTLIPKKKNLDLNYVVYALQESATHNKRIDTNGAKIMNNEMAVIQIAFPPLAEQTAIAAYLDEKTQKIDAIVANVGNQIETLKELRKTLINDVVTGKIKVTTN